MTLTPIPEPRGHSDQFSKVERVWNTIPKGFTFERRRVERFDSVNMIAYSPMEYELRPLESLDFDLDDSGIASILLSFIRDEFETNRSADGVTLNAPRIVAKEITSFEHISEFMARTEEELIYGPHMKALRQRASSSEGEFVYEVLCDPKLGNPQNRKYIEKAAFENNIDRSVSNQERLLFAFLGFPFKDQNPTRTDAAARHVDLAEVSMLIHLHLQAEGIFQGHPFGVDYVIVSDGGLYSRIFGVSRNETERYLSRLRAVRNSLNLQASIHILELEHCVARLPDRDQEGFYSLQRRVRNLINSAKFQADPAAGQAMNALVKGMRRNINLREMLQPLDWSEKVALVYGSGSPMSDSASRLDRDIKLESENAAIEYAATNVALRAFRVVERTLGKPIRATIHPKPDQVAVPRSGNAYPWNGVGIWEPDAGFPDGMRAAPFSDLGQRKVEWIAGYLPGDEYPAYYRPK